MMMVDGDDEMDAVFFTRNGCGVGFNSVSDVLQGPGWCCS